MGPERVINHLLLHEMLAISHFDCGWLCAVSDPAFILPENYRRDTEQEIVQVHSPIDQQ